MREKLSSPQHKDSVALFRARRDIGAMNDPRDPLNPPNPRHI
jgi:hypothetical protein